MPNKINTAKTTWLLTSRVLIPCNSRNLTSCLHYHSASPHENALLFITVSTKQKSSTVQALLTRQQYISCSELQAGAGSRRSAQAMVIPLASSATPSQYLPEAPTLLIINDRPSRAGPRRLNTIYIVAGLKKSQ